MQNWYALNTKPRCEQVVYEGLANRKIEAYLPLWQVRARGGRNWVERPFFPGYLFVHADLDEVGRSALQYLSGVRELVMRGEEPATVPAALVESIREHLAERKQSVTDAAGLELRPGDTVRIVEGPLAGLEGIFDAHISSHDRVRLLINFIRKGAPVEVDRESIEKVRLNEWARKQLERRRRR